MAGRPAISFEDRFWEKVDKQGPTPGHRPELGPCWPWRAYVDERGYGIFKLTTNRNVKAHRFAYQLDVGPIPEGLQLDHQCHNTDPTCPGGRTCWHRRCCNPSHLEPATNRENGTRGRAAVVNAARQQAKTHCRKGHPFDEANTRWTVKGWRECRACDRQQARASRHRRKGGTLPVTRDATPRDLQGRDLVPAGHDPAGGYPPTRAATPEERPRRRPPTTGFP